VHRNQDRESRRQAGEPEPVAKEPAADVNAGRSLERQARIPDAERSSAAAAGQLDPAGRFAQQLDFIVAIDKLKNVLRTTRLTDESRRENSAEHSWHLAVMALLLHEHAAESVDVVHALELLLVHDIVEIDAGDTDCYDTDGHADKQQRERSAAARLFGMLPDDQSSRMLALWEEFEAMTTPAARFANALDRLQPLIIGRHRDSGDWRFRASNPEQLLARMEPVREAAPQLWSWILSVVDEAFRTGRHG
jgi:putative hydrolases of HD superfamily